MKKTFIGMAVAAAAVYAAHKYATKDNNTGVRIATAGGRSYNNPLNIKNSPVKFEGEEESAGTFTNFKSMAYGYRAALRILRTYAERDGIVSLYEAIKKFSGNDNAYSYASYVSKNTGLPMHANNFKEVINNKDNAAAILYYMGKFEQGQKFEIAINDIIQGVNLA